MKYLKSNSSQRKENIKDRKKNNLIKSCNKYQKHEVWKKYVFSNDEFYNEDDNYTEPTNSTNSGGGLKNAILLGTGSVAAIAVGILLGRKPKD